MTATLQYLKDKGIPITRDNYLNIAYFGNPPEKLSSEEESMLPEEVQQETNEQE